MYQVYKIQNVAENIERELVGKFNTLSAATLWVSYFSDEDFEIILNNP